MVPWYKNIILHTYLGMQWKDEIKDNGDNIQKFPANLQNWKKSVEQILFQGLQKGFIILDLQTSGFQNYDTTFMLFSTKKVLNIKSINS